MAAVRRSGAESDLLPSQNRWAIRNLLKGLMKGE
jgi:hypothetical protein